MLDPQSGSRDTVAGAGSEQYTDVRASRAPISGRIGFIGLGRMGLVMAGNLAAAGYQVAGYVRREGLMDDVRAAGVVPSTDLTDLFDCEAVITMLPDDDAVRGIVLGDNGLAAGLPRGAIHLSMSTISTAAATELANEHTRRGQDYVAAPVFGNPDAARARQLFVVAAGAPAALERCRSLTDVLGQTFTVGDDPKMANLIKLLGNMMTATALEVLGETIAVFRKSGHDPRPFIDILTGTMFGGRVHKIYGNKILDESYAPGMVMPLALKDVRLALAEAEKAGVPMPSVSVVRDRLISGIARGHAGLDWTALGLVAAEAAGISARQ